KGFGSKSAAAVLRRYGRIEDVPDTGWDGMTARSLPTLAARLAAERDHALLFKDLATLRVDRSLLGSIDELAWKGPTPEFAAVCEALGAEGLAERAESLSRSLAS
ncbi:MAG: flap endonuclease, partial [Actinobacteria bacterium]|nr:flap endonuclease [Actinomycetota bacterium]